MNKRNTTIALLVLVVLIFLLFAKTCSFNSTIRELPDNFPDTYKVDVNVMLDKLSLDSLEEASYPIVIHYQKPRRFGNSYFKNHVLSQNVSMFTANPKELDSTKAIHVYTKSIRKKTKYIYLGLYSNTSMEEDVEYKLTYPVSDSLGLRVVKDSGVVCTNCGTTLYGPIISGKNKGQDEEYLTKQIEDNLLKDIFKKMKRNKGSE